MEEKSSPAGDWRKPAQPRLAAHRPSRGEPGWTGKSGPAGDWRKPAQPQRCVDRGPTGAGQAGRGREDGPHQARRSTGPAGAQKRPELAGNGLNRPRTNLFWPKKGQNRCMPARRHEFWPKKDICQPGSAGIDPGPTYVGRDINMSAGTHICQPEEAECWPGDADVDLG
jgi:hypothetical protein